MKCKMGLIKSREQTMGRGAGGDHTRRSEGPSHHLRAIAELTKEREKCFILVCQKVKRRCAVCDLEKRRWCKGKW